VTVSGTPSSGRSTSVAAYEQLRSQAIAGATSGSHFGLILLLREGIAAWIARARIDFAPAESPVDPNFCAASSALPTEIHAGIVGVLANMAMASRKEMSE
jgi:hypothetical protein